MNTIPPLDLGRQYRALQDDINAAVLAVLASGQYIGGPQVTQFEQAFATYINTPFCISCNSGTDALYLALRAFDIGPGDEVITSPFTFIATAEVISMAGATPIFVDIIPETFNLDPQQVQSAITPRTRAIMPVHLFGQPADMTQLMAIAQAHALPVIEDCAQATGAVWPDATGQPQKVGSIGHIGCFSFYPSKNLGGCGDGGAITTRNSDLAEKMRVLRDHGRSSGYIHEAIGTNSRLDAVQAAILSVKLRHLDRWNLQRKAIAERYGQLLGNIPGITVPPDRGDSVWNQYTIRVAHEGDLQYLRRSRDRALLSEADFVLRARGVEPPAPRRDRVRVALAEQGVQSMVYYPLPLHLQPVYAHLDYELGQLPIADKAALEVLSLPMFPELTPPEQERIRNSLKEVLPYC
ncbi:DegT/DnrJ/EryC1/StrS family aminotransferase [Altericista sp. CCNU0014]|uniref:DegT/DnrJ/EryC1/StrS family aminotransferase n=1 Tax=Altericista sp. CCNU0014 TaxID=3082949 RepID=UPI00384DA4B2